MLIWLDARLFLISARPRRSASGRSRDIKSASSGT